MKTNTEPAVNRESNVDKPYDWEHYELEFFDNANYRAQERWLTSFFESLASPSPTGSANAFPSPPDSILEVGPGLGRITRLALAAFPLASYSAADIALAPLAEAERLSGGLEASYHGSIAAPNFLGLGSKTGRARSAYDLVLAIEVLMHVPPEELDMADAHLYALTKPRGHLIVCDWTEPLPDRADGSPTPIRVQNYRHNYMETLFGQDFELVYAEPIGYQTLRVFRR